MANGRPTLQHCLQLPFVRFLRSVAGKNYLRLYDSSPAMRVFAQSEREVNLHVQTRSCLSSCSSLKFTKEVSIVGNRENETVVGIGEAAGGQGI